MQTAFATEPGYVPAPPDLGGFLEQRFVASSPAMLEGMGNAIRDEPDRVDELRATGIRTLVACGANDDAWPPSVQKEMADRLGAPFEVIPDAAHSPAIENPDATIAVLLDFWQAS
jgi:pimeloyl-ACP methyl ester carboxylesterase